MSQIKATNTKPEMLVRKFLHAYGYRYTLYNKKLPGKPGIGLPKYKTIIFINACLPDYLPERGRQGCFWQGYKNYKYFVVPKLVTFLYI
jgi:DNA mismatch endonuclease (patch repair protein)